MIDNIIELHRELAEKKYNHGKYLAFSINDPKPRRIHKTSVRDRLLHHAVSRILYPYFDRKFIYDSYSCRADKGTHRAVNRLRYFARKVSGNNTRTAWILKCDIKKFFENIDHKILKDTLRKHIEDKNTIWILNQVIDSFHSKGKSGVGLPLGNLTSQLFINIYMNEFDRFVKRKLKIQYYLRYADDFIILDSNKDILCKYTSILVAFLKENLKLEFHPNKISIKTFASGVDFLGWVQFPHHRILRTTTKRRMFRKLNENRTEETKESYLGLLKHGNTYGLRKKIEKN